MKLGSFTSTWPSHFLAVEEYNDSTIVTVITLLRANATIVTLLLIHSLYQYGQGLNQIKYARKRIVIRNLFGWISYNMIQIYRCLHALHGCQRNKNLKVSNIRWKVPGKINVLNIWKIIIFVLFSADLTCPIGRYLHHWNIIWSRCRFTRTWPPTGKYYATSSSSYVPIVPILQMRISERFNSRWIR